jgi:hypothetical protein
MATPLDTVSNTMSAPDNHAHSPRSSSDVEEAPWMKEKSREELSDLLTKADDIIRVREQGEFFEPFLLHARFYIYCSPRLSRQSSP